MRADEVRDRLSLDQLQDEVRTPVRGPAVEQPRDVRVVEAGEHLSLLHEAPPDPLGVDALAQQLQGDALLELPVAPLGDPDLAHAAAPEQRDEDVRADRLARRAVGLRPGSAGSALSRGAYSAAPASRKAPAALSAASELAHEAGERRGRRPRAPRAAPASRPARAPRARRRSRRLRSRRGAGPSVTGGRPARKGCGRESRAPPATGAAPCGPTPPASSRCPRPRAPRRSATRRRARARARPLLELDERLVEREQLLGLLREQRRVHVFERQVRLAPAPLVAQPVPGVVDEHHPHRPGRRRVEVEAVADRPRVAARELQVGLVHERGRVDRAVEAGRDELPVRELAHLSVDGREEPVHRPAIPGLGGVQEARDLARGRRFPFRRRHLGRHRVSREHSPTDSRCPVPGRFVELLQRRRPP